MKLLYSVFFLSFLMIASVVKGQSDTIQTFTFKDSTKRSGMFKFPSADIKYRKVLMLYTLKCYPKVSKYDNKYPCGEWDYLTYTFVTTKSSEVFEIARYITPYGINLTLGPNGFTWVYDVTDYLNLLRDSVKLSAGNTQELLDLKFVFTKGNLPAKVLKINQIWDKGATSYSYADLSSDKRLFPKALKIMDSSAVLKYRGRITGHGHNSNDGKYPHCCEWKNNTHSLYSGSKLIGDWSIWQTLDCADNPVFPQGGTWPYAREGWCPGDKVKDNEWDVTRFKSGDSLRLDYRITPVPTDNLGMGGGNYVMAHHLIEYGKPNFANDAEILEVVAPSTQQIRSRFNPACAEPKIILRNNSLDTMNACELEYSVSGGYTMKYKWKGKLGFLQTEVVDLPIYDAGFFRGDGKNMFKCSVLSRNGKADDHPDNNMETSNFKLPDIYKDKLFIEFKTNNFPTENKYVLRDSRDSIILQRDQLAANKVYRDTLKNLKPGCYTLELTDEGTDGLSFWANSAQGSGYLRLRKATANTVLKNFGTDFGYRIYYAFIADSLQIGKQPEEPIIDDSEKVFILPNPSQGDFKIITAGLSGVFKLEMYDAVGHKVFGLEQDLDLKSDIEIRGLNASSGLYFIRLSQDSKTLVKRLILE